MASTSGRAFIPSITSLKSRGIVIKMPPGRSSTDATLLTKGMNAAKLTFMNLIRDKLQLSADVYQMVVEAPLIARERKAGQFIILQLDSTFAERIPLTIADADEAAGTITLIFQAVGGTTRKLALKNKGDTIENLLGPLGQPTHIQNYGRAVCVGGGIGVAPLHPIAQALKKAGNHVTIVVGARNRDLVILEKEMRGIADEFILCTDDGSAGRQALVTVPLKELCEGPDKPGIVVAIGGNHPSLRRSHLLQPQLHHGRWYRNVRRVPGDRRG